MHEAGKPLLKLVPPLIFLSQEVGFRSVAQCCWRLSIDASSQAVGDEAMVLALEMVMRVAVHLKNGNQLVRLHMLHNVVRA